MEAWSRVVKKWVDGGVKSPAVGRNSINYRPNRAGGNNSLTRLTTTTRVSTQRCWPPSTHTVSEQDAITFPRVTLHQSCSSIDLGNLISDAWKPVNYGAEAIPLFVDLGKRYSLCLFSFKATRRETICNSTYPDTDLKGSFSLHGTQYPIPPYCFWCTSYQICTAASDPSSTPPFRKSLTPTSLSIGYVLTPTNSFLTSPGKMRFQIPSKLSASSYRMPVQLASFHQPPRSSRLLFPSRKRRNSSHDPSDGVDLEKACLKPLRRLPLQVDVCQEFTHVLFYLSTPSHSNIWIKAGKIRRADDSMETKNARFCTSNCSGWLKVFENFWTRSLNTIIYWLWSIILFFSTTNVQCVMEVVKDLPEADECISEDWKCCRAQGPEFRREKGPSLTWMLPFFCCHLSAFFVPMTAEVEQPYWIRTSCVCMNSIQITPVVVDYVELSNCCQKSFNPMWP